MVKGTPLAKWGPHGFIVVVVSVVVGLVVNFGVIIIIIFFNYTLIHVLTVDYVTLCVPKCGNFNRNK